MQDPDKILKGEVKYTLEDFYLELKEKWIKTVLKDEIDEKKKIEIFKNLFMFILLSSEDKPFEVMKNIFNNMPEEAIKKSQEAFEKEIDVARHIQMKMYLDIYGGYMAGMEMTIRMLNIKIHEFLDKYIKEEDQNVSA